MLSSPRERHSSIWFGLFLLFLLGLIGLVAGVVIGSKMSRAKGGASVTSVKNQPYSSDTSNSQQQFDMYLPSNTASNDSKSLPPLMVVIHGGLWVSGDKSQLANIGNTFASTSKLPVASINYRLSSSSNGLKHPVHIRDVITALDHLSQPDVAAQYKYDPQKMILVGHSAGATMIGLLPVYIRKYQEVRSGERFEISRVLGAVGVQGIYDLKLFAQDFPQWKSSLEVSVCVSVCLCVCSCQM